MGLADQKVDGTKTTVEIDFESTEETDLLKLSNEELINKVIKPLRKEAASRRVKNKELDTTISSLNEKLKTVEEGSEKQKELIVELEKIKEEKELVDASEVEKLQKVAEKLVRENEELKNKATNKEQELLFLKEEVSKKTISSTALNNLTTKGYKFKNDFEKNGFLSVILQKKDDGSYRSEDEVKEIVEQFLKENYEPPKPSPGGPGGSERKIGLSVEEELKQLMSKPRLSKDEINRLKEIEAELEKELPQNTKRRTWTR